MSGVEEDHKQYYGLRQLLHKFANHNKTEYYSQIVNEAEGNQKRLFGIIKFLVSSKIYFSISRGDIAIA